MGHKASYLLSSLAQSGAQFWIWQCEDNTPYNTSIYQRHLISFGENFSTATAILIPQNVFQSVVRILVQYCLEV